MSEDVRRSGRANKGHHTKNQDSVEEPAPPVTPKPLPQAKGGKKGKGQPARAQSVQSADQENEGEDEDAIIRCVCGDQRDIRGRQMICCDTCLAWQHNKCLNLPEGDYWENKNYFCERCKPEDHQELLAAMARGEKPWARKKGSKPKSRPSDVKQDFNLDEHAAAQGPISPRSPSAALGQDEHAIQEDIKENTQPQSPLGEKRPLEKGQEKATTSKRRRKSTHPEVKLVEKSAPAENIESLPNLRKLLAGSLRDTLVPLITSASDRRDYRIPDGDTATSLGANLALQISHAAHELYGEPTGRESPYASKVRAIIFNVKKNEGLINQLLSGSLKVPDFVAMEPEEMASEEKQREYAAMREAAEKQMILTEETKPRIRKTHKGEEIVGEDNFVAQEFKQPNLRERDDDEEIQSPTTARPLESPADVNRGPISDYTAETQSEHVRRPSTTFDINSVFNKVKSPSREKSVFLPRRQNSMATNDKSNAAMDDADVDRLLKDEDNDVEMSGISSDPSVCWKGSINMQNLTPFDAVARFVAGGDFGQVVSWDKLMSSTLSVQGRIASAKGDDYIRGIGDTESHDVAILALSPITVEGRSVMDHLFNYFHSRGRWGVVPVDSFGNDIMRDLYVIPVEAGGSNLPPFIDMLEYCTIETPRKEDMMLLALIAKLPEPQQPQQPRPDKLVAAPTTKGPIQSPIPNPHTPQFSPVGANFPLGQYNNSYASHPATNGQNITIPPNAPPHHHVPKALEILGPYIDAPVIINILDRSPQNQAMTEQMLSNLRYIVQTIPEARTDISVLTEHLRNKNEANKQNPAAPMQ